MAALVDLLGNSLPDAAILAVSASFLSVRRRGRVAREPDVVPALARSQPVRRQARRHRPFRPAGAFGLHSRPDDHQRGLSLTKTEDNARQEGVSIYRLGRELDALGPAAGPAKAALAAYARDVAGDEWRRLAKAPNALSPLAQNDLDALWTNLRAVQKTLAPTDPSRFDLARYADKIESLRRPAFPMRTPTYPAPSG